VNYPFKDVTVSARFLLHFSMIKIEDGDLGTLNVTEGFDCL